MKKVHQLKNQKNNRKPNNYWTKELCVIEAIKYKSKMDFKHGSGSAYTFSCKGGWLDEICEHMISIRKPKGYWIIERCREEALKYKFKVDFRNDSTNVYSAAKRKGWLNEICQHMKPKGCRYNKYVYVYEFPDNHAYVGLTYDIDIRTRIREKNINDSVTKYKIKSKLESKLIILTELIPVEKAIELEEYYYQLYMNNGWIMLNQAKTGSIGSVKKWTKEKCIKIAKKCKNRTEFYLNYSGAFQAAKQNNWLIDVLLQVPLIRKNNGYWSKEKCIEMVVKCNSRTEFRKLYRSAYTISIKNRWLNEIYLIVGL